jgi:hypothetical protein
MFGGNTIAEYSAVNGVRSNAGFPSETDLLPVQYTALRSEINLAVQSRNTILTFGFVAPGRWRRVGSLLSILWTPSRSSWSLAWAGRR